MGAWNSADNSIPVSITAEKAVTIELYAQDGTQMDTFSGDSGTHIFHHNDTYNNGNYTVKVKSAAGYHPNAYPFQVSELDKAAPCQLTAISPEGWSSEKEISVRAADQTNALFTVQYEDGTPVPYLQDQEGSAAGGAFEASFTITEQIPGQKGFILTAVDRWGHSASYGFSVGKIDSQQPTKPNVELPGPPASERPTVSLDENDGWHNTDVTVSISGSGADSGIDHYEYRVDGGDWQTGDSILLRDEGIHMVEVKAVSGVGIESEVVGGTIKIDKTAPTASYTLSPDAATFTTEAVTITLHPADLGGSGLASVILPDGTTAERLDAIPFPVSQNGDYTFTITDHAQNETRVTVPVGNLAEFDVTVTLNTPFVISPDRDSIHSNGIAFANRSNVPVRLHLQRASATGTAPKLVGPDAKEWNSLSRTESKRFLALGLKGHGADLWLSDGSQEVGTLAKGVSVTYDLQARYGYAWDTETPLNYNLAFKIALV